MVELAIRDVLLAEGLHVAVRSFAEPKRGALLRLATSRPLFIARCQMNSDSLGLYLGQLLPDTTDELLLARQVPVCEMRHWPSGLVRGYRSAKK